MNVDKLQLAIGTSREIIRLRRASTCAPLAVVLASREPLASCDMRGWRRTQEGGREGGTEAEVEKAAGFQRVQRAETVDHLPHAYLSGFEAVPIQPAHTPGMTVPTGFGEVRYLVFLNR